MRRGLLELTGLGGVHAAPGAAFERRPHLRQVPDVHVRVDEAGHDVPALEIDHARIRWRPSGSNRLDAPAHQDDGNARPHAAGAYIDEVGVGEGE